MVLGPQAGSELARRLHLDALFLLREGKEVRSQPVGLLFGGGSLLNGARASTLPVTTNFISGSRGA
jgi:thiamine biosynthesis lipoprotein